MQDWNENIFESYKAERLPFTLNKPIKNDEEIHNKFCEICEKMEQAYALVENGGKAPKVTGEYEKLGLKIGLRDELSGLIFTKLLTYISLLEEWGEEGFHNDTVACYSGREYTEADRESFKEDWQDLTRFFEMLEPNVLTPWLLKEAADPCQIPSLITVYFCILGRWVDYMRVTPSYKNPYLRTFPLFKVSEEVKNLLLRSNKIEQLFDSVLKGVDYSTIPVGKEEVALRKGDRVVPILFDSIRKNMFPRIKIKKSQLNLPYMNYLVLKEEGQQPLAVMEVMKKKIDVKNLIDLDTSKNREIASYMGEQEILLEFMLILLDIMFSKKLQELLKKYAFYHKTLVDLAYNGKFESLEKLTEVKEEETIPFKEIENNPNSKIKGVWKIGFYLYNLYLYLGIYKSLIGYKEFYYNKDFYPQNPENSVRYSHQLVYRETYGFIDPAVEVIIRYYKFIEAMDDFSLKVEGGLGKIPEDGVLKAKIYSYKAEKEEELLLEERKKKEREVQEVEWDVKEILEGYKKRKIKENYYQ